MAPIPDRGFVVSLRRTVGTYFRGLERNQTVLATMRHFALTEPGTSRGRNPDTCREALRP